MRRLEMVFERAFNGGRHIEDDDGGGWLGRGKIVSPGAWKIRVLPNRNGDVTSAALPLPPALPFSFSFASSTSFRSVLEIIPTVSNQTLCPYLSHVREIPLVQP